MSDASAPASKPAGAEKDSPKQRLLRLGFLALLAGGLVLWTQLRKPRALGVKLDLTAALPGELREIDLIVRRGDRVLVREDRRFDNGAPQIFSAQVQATPGDAELEADLIYRDRAATRTRAAIHLSSDAPAQVLAKAAR